MEVGCFNALTGILLKQYTLYQETSRNFHYWQPAPRWRPLPWLVNPRNRAKNPHAKDEIGTRHTELTEGGKSA